MPARSKKTPETVEKVLQLLRSGKYLYEVCAECDLAEMTISDWRQKDPEFERMYWDARRFAVEREMENLKIELNGMQVGNRADILVMKERLAQARWEAERLIPQYHNTIKSQVDAKVDSKVEHVITFSGQFGANDAKVIEGEVVSGVKELEDVDRAGARPVSSAG